MTVSLLDLCGRDSCVSRKRPDPVRWAVTDQWCYHCGTRWEEVVSFKSVRQLNAYRPECPRCIKEPE